MNCFTFHITVLVWMFIKEINLSNSSKCPYKHVNGAEALDIEDLTAFSAKNTLAELGINEIGNLNVIKPIKETAMSEMEIESWIKNSFHSNDIKKDVVYGSHDYQKYDSSFLEPMTASGIDCAVPPASCFNDSKNYYFRTYDGSCNNFEHPGYGMAKSRYSRILKPKYGDGFYAPSKSSTGIALPNPRILSLSLYGEDTFSETDRTLMSMQFGQFVSHDISELYRKDLPDDCCTNPGHKMCYAISLHPFDPIAMTSGKTCLHFVRSLSDRDVTCPPNGLPYAEKITISNAFLDLSSIYGNSLEQNVKIRQYKSGLLKINWFNNKPFLPIQSSKCPANNENCYSIPDNRNQFTPTIAVIHTLFVREHNRLASILARINPHYSDERIFQLARKINIAQFQKITYYDWLPIILSPTYIVANRLVYTVSAFDYVNDYEQNMNPAPYAEYAASAFRYLHQAVPGWFSMVSSSRNNNETLRLSDYFDRQDTVKLLMNEDNFDSLIRGLATQLEKRSDSNVDPEIKHHFGRKYFEEFGTDLKSIDIQRGRDFGIPSYNDFRVHCGLPRAYQWSDFLNDIPDEKVELLKKFYDSPNDVELSIGGSYERHVPDSMLGPTFQCIIGNQFLKTRIADRFFYENEDANSGFTREQLAEIRKTSFASILCANSNNVQCIQRNVFFFPNYQNNMMKCNEFNQLNLGLWKDYFGY